MKEIFTKKINKTALVISITCIALFTLGTIAYASIPSFHNFVNSTIGIEKKDANNSNDNNNNDKVATEENNTDVTSEKTITTEKPTEDNNTNTSVSTTISPTATTPKTNAPTPTTMPTTATTVTIPAPTFRVSSVVASVSPLQGPIPCNKQTSFEFTFSGTITATSAGTVQYTWVQSDGGGSSGTLTFGSAGSQQVTTSWTIYGPTLVAGWSKVVITSPNSISSNQATFTKLYCPSF